MENKEQVQEQPKKKKSWFKKVLIATGVVIAGVTVYSCGKNGVKGTAEMVGTAVKGAGKKLAGVFKKKGCPTCGEDIPSCELSRDQYRNRGDYRPRYHQNNNNINN